jgi:putative transposase
VLADAGVENVNAQVDALLATGVLRRLLAMTELKFSNSLIEAWWRSLKHHWLFLHALDSVPMVRRLVAFYVEEHNRVLPHSAFGARRQTRCTSGRATRSPRNSRRVLGPPAGHACRPTDQ